LPESSVVEGSLETIVRSPAVGNGQFSGLKVNVEGPARVTCEWRIDAGPDDVLFFIVNGYAVSRLDGSPDWAERSFEVPEGTHEVEWRYSKDSTFSLGSDAGFLRNISVEPFLTFDLWLGGFLNNEQLLDPTFTDPSGNPDGDAWTTFEEYIFGGNPVVADSGPLPNEPKLVFDAVEGFVYRFDLPMGVQDVLVGMQDSTNLETWTDRAVVGVPVDGVIRYQVPISGAEPRLYVRFVMELDVPAP
jgi:hypothetical protein